MATSSLRTLKIMSKHLNEILRSWIRLQWQTTSSSPSFPNSSTQRRCKKRPHNQRRREKERRTQEVRKENTRAVHVAALPITASAAAFFQQYLYLPLAAAVQEAARQVAAVPTAAIQVAASSRFSSCSTSIAVVPRAAVQVAAGLETAVSPIVATLNAACSKKKRKN